MDAQPASHATPRMPSAPRIPLPPNACDCHAHVFGPYETFPVVHAMHYEAPLAPAALHREMLARAGLSRGVLIQPGSYGTEPAALIDALKQSGGKARGIAVADSMVSDRTLDEWHDAGVRGLRFNDMLVPGGSTRFSGSVGSDQLEFLAPRLAARGWHAEIWATAAQHAASISRYRAAELQVVLDHMGGVSPAAGIEDPAVRAILAALSEGWMWVKLSLCRCSQQFPGYDDLKPLHDAFVGARPDRMVWGSDWPYLRLGDKTPDVGNVLDIFSSWVTDEQTRRTILADNPAHLYDFDR